MKILFSLNFKKRVKKLPLPIKRKLKHRLALFMEDPFNELLKNHAFGGKWKWYRTIALDQNYRLVFRMLPQGYYFFVEAAKVS